MSTFDRRHAAKGDTRRPAPSTSIVLLAAALLLGGCTAGRAFDGRPGTVGEGTIRLDRGTLHIAEVSYEGRRYAGPWSDESCKVDSCGDVYLATPRLHWRNLSKGHAVLTAADGSRLECDWISRRNEIDGTCRTGDGSAIRLRGEGAGGAD